MLFRSRITKILTPDQAAQLEMLKAEERRARDLREVDRSLAAWTKPLGLSPEQAEGLKAVLLGSKEKKRGYFGERRHEGDQGKVREFLQGVRAEQNKAAEKVLKPEQYARYLELSEHER